MLIEHRVLTVTKKKLLLPPTLWEHKVTMVQNKTKKSKAMLNNKLQREIWNREGGQ